MPVLLALLILVASLAVLGVVVVRTWRRVTSLGRTVADAGARIGAASADMEARTRRDDTLR